MHSNNYYVYTETHLSTVSLKQSASKCIYVLSIKADWSQSIFIFWASYIYKYAKLTSTLNSHNDRSHAPKDIFRPLVQHFLELLYRSWISVKSRPLNFDQAQHSVQWFWVCYNWDSPLRFSIYISNAMTLSQKRCLLQTSLPNARLTIICHSDQHCGNTLHHIVWSLTFDILY